jgi:transcriptional regulator with XRE-family HTH domain
VNNKADIREFLASRRARITPEQAGVTNFGGSRRVAGLRRAEVAMIAGVSPDYYARLERGTFSGVSDSVPDAISGHRSSTRPSGTTCTTWRAPPI